MCRTQIKACMRDCMEEKTKEDEEHEGTEQREEREREERRQRIEIESTLIRFFAFQF